MDLATRDLAAPIATLGAALVAAVVPLILSRSRMARLESGLRIRDHVQPAQRDAWDAMLFEQVEHVLRAASNPPAWAQVVAPYGAAVAVAAGFFGAPYWVALVAYILVGLAWVRLGYYLLSRKRYRRALELRVQELKAETASLQAEARESAEHTERLRSQSWQAMWALGLSLRAMVADLRKADYEAHEYAEGRGSLPTPGPEFSRLGAPARRVRRRFRAGSSAPGLPSSAYSRSSARKPCRDRHAG